jgi:exonuclease VII small subunit
MERIERIKQMEACLEQASAAVKELSAALEQYEEAREAIKTLDKYLGSRQWKLDCKTDEDGKLPKDLKRGVLSEDGIWNVLEESRRLDELFRTS